MTASELEVAGVWLRDPIWLWAILLVALVAWLRRRRGHDLLVVPFAASWAAKEGVRRSPIPEVLAVAGLALLILGLARPQTLDDRHQPEREGYDLILALDLSGSMLAEDGEVDGERASRLQALKPILEAFLARRQGDRIGLVAFGGRAYTLAPLSFDHDWLARQIERLQIGLVEDGTAVGDAVALAVTRLAQPGRQEDGRRLGGFVILLTDGANNAGHIAPLESARLAEARGIPVYTIAAGSDGPVPMPVFDDQGRKRGYRRVLMELDEETLMTIAEMTGGRYYRAQDTDTVDEAFAAIDAARKIEFDARSDLGTKELFPPVVGTGLASLFVAFALAGRGGREPSENGR